jgi:hypothetical protein
MSKFDTVNICRNILQPSCILWFISVNSFLSDRLCGLVVRVPGYRSRGQGSIPVYTRIFERLLGLERGPLSLVSKIEELLGRKRSGSGLESREYVCRDPSLTLQTIGGCSVGIIRSRTQATEFSFFGHPDLELEWNLLNFAALRYVMSRHVTLSIWSAFRLSEHHYIEVNFDLSCSTSSLVVPQKRIFKCTI